MKKRILCLVAILVTMSVAPLFASCGYTNVTISGTYVYLDDAREVVFSMTELTTAESITSGMVGMPTGDGSYTLYINQKQVASGTVYKNKNKKGTFWCSSEFGGFNTSFELHGAYDNNWWNSIWGANRFSNGPNMKIFDIVDGKVKKALGGLMVVPLSVYVPSGVYENEDATFDIGRPAAVFTVGKTKYNGDVVYTFSSYDKKLSRLFRRNGSILFEFQFIEDKIMIYNIADSIKEKLNGLETLTLTKIN